MIDKYAPSLEENKISQAFETLKNNEQINGFSKWNNDVEIGQKPILMECSNLAGNFIDNARKENVEDLKGEKGYGRNEKRVTENITNDIRIDRRNRGKGLQSHDVGDEPSGRNGRLVSIRTNGSNGRPVSDNAATGGTGQDERERPAGTLRVDLQEDTNDIISLKNDVKESFDSFISQYATDQKTREDGVRVIENLTVEDFDI